MKPNKEQTLGLLREGKDRNEVKDFLIQEGLNPEEVASILKEADNTYMNELINKRDKEPLIPLKIKAYGLILLGAGFSAATYTGLIDLRGGYILWYGPIIAGFSMFAYDRRMKRKSKQKNFIRKNLN